MSATTERCSICGHAASRHNELGYCTVTSRSKGDCICDSTRRSEKPLALASGESWKAREQEESVSPYPKAEEPQ